MRLISFAEQKNRDRGDIVSLHFSPDNRTLAAVERFDDKVYFSWWDLQKQSERTSSADGLGFDHVADPVLSSDHRFLAYVYDRQDNSLQLIDQKVPEGSKKRERFLTTVGQKVHYMLEGGYQALRFSPDNRFLVAAVQIDEDRTGIYRWNVNAVLQNRGPKSGKIYLLANPAFIPMPEPNADHDHSVRGRSLVFSPDGSILAAGLWNERILRWEFPSGRELPELPMKKRRNSYAWRLAFSPDSQTLAVADQSVTLYDSRTATPQMVLATDPPKISRGEYPNAYDIEFHPSGHLLATACGSDLVRFWDGETGVEKETFDWKMGNVRAVTFSPDGCLCAAAGKKGIAIWDVNQ
jgi:WD40 repeat protein